MKRYSYINALGYAKELIVHPVNENGEHPISVWCNGDCCGTGTITPDKLAEYLQHYNAKEMK